MGSLTIRNGFLGKKLELLFDHLNYEGHPYSYADVIHLGRYAQRTSVNFLPMENYVRIKIYLRNNSKPITIANSFGLIGTAGKIKKAYELLVEKTFQLRIKSYLEQIDTAGFFEYSGAKFFASGDVLIKNEKINLRTAKMWLEPFNIILKEPTGLFARKRKISTDIDQDVFLALLKEIYGIKFGT